MTSHNQNSIQTATNEKTQTPVGECYIDRCGVMHLYATPDDGTKTEGGKLIHIGYRDNLELKIPQRSYRLWLDYLCRQMDWGTYTLAERTAVAETIEDAFAYKVKPQLTAPRFCRLAKTFIPLR